MSREDFEIIAVDAGLSDGPPVKLFEKYAETILSDGQAIQYVLSDKSDPDDVTTHSPFGYTIGNRLRSRPEMIMVGAMHPEWVADVMNWISEHYSDVGPFEDGKIFFTTGEQPFMMRKLGSYAKSEYSLGATSFYKWTKVLSDPRDYELYQIVLSDNDGSFDENNEDVKQVILDQD